MYHHVINTLDGTPLHLYYVPGQHVSTIQDLGGRGSSLGWFLRAKMLRWVLDSLSHDLQVQLCLILLFIRVIYY